MWHMLQQLELPGDNLEDQYSDQLDRYTSTGYYLRTHTDPTPAPPGSPAEPRCPLTQTAPHTAQLAQLCPACSVRRERSRTQVVAQ